MSQSGINEASIKALDASSAHRISLGQVVIDLQTAVKELLENSLDAGATSIEVRFKEHGLQSVEAIDNGSGIAPDDYDAIGLKHHTSKLSSFSDLADLHTFGFRGEALSALCALAEQVTVTTATSAEVPMGTIIELDRNGRVTSKQGKVARQRGTTVTVSGLFKPLPVRRKEFERNAKREFGKTLTLLSAYALVPCAQENRGVRLTVTHLTSGGKKTVQLRTDGTPATRASVSALWGPRTLEHLVALDLHFDVEIERSVLRRQGILDGQSHSNAVSVRGLISKFAVGCGRTGTDRQFFFINGRPCSPSKVQKAFNEVYRTFNANQAPFIVADFLLPTDSCDVNVSPDKRTILLHSENNLVQALKVALEDTFAPARATYDVNVPAASQAQRKNTTDIQNKAPPEKRGNEPLFLEEDEAEIAVRQGGTISQSSMPPSTREDFGVPRPLLGRSDTATTILDNFCRSVEDAEDEAIENINGPPTSGDLGLQDPRVPLASSCRIEPLMVSSDTPVSSHHRAASQVLQNDHDVTDRRSEPDAQDNNGDLSFTMTQIGTAIGDSGSPSATQVSGASAQREEHARGRSNASVGSLHTQSIASAPGGSDEKRAANSDVDRGTRSVQMVLSTVGASWNMGRSVEDGVTPPSKRRKTGDGVIVDDGRSARQDLRTKLGGFARIGSQVAPLEDQDEDRENGDEDVTPNNEDNLSDDVEDVQADGEDDGMDVDDAGPPFVEDDMPPMQVDEADSADITKSDDAQVIDLTQDIQDDPRLCDAPEGDETNQSSAATSSLSASSSSRVSHLEVIRTSNGEEITIHIDLARITSSWRRLQQASSIPEAAQGVKPTSGVQDHAGVASEDGDKAAEALSRVIEKSDFSLMKVVGQFNLGFIIARRQQQSLDSTDDVVARDDLFIIDQHAADEKYNFEALQQSTKIESQKLFRPRPLELTAADELLAMENMDVLHQNGFEVEESDDPVSGEGHKLSLVAQPISKGTVFDMKDLEELLHLMQDRPTGQMVRCSKARAMFAMRACRKSVMVGMPLNHRQMTSVIRHMGTMDQPWHCPHGRPTMRHLSDIAGIGRQWRPEHSRSIQWANLGS